MVNKRGTNHQERQEMKIKFVRSGLACVLGLILCGCASYYKVTDTASGRVYYTDKIQHKGSGSIYFKDEVSKVFVTLSGSEIMKLTRDQYMAQARPK
jgi:hypothetical protein